MSPERLDVGGVPLDVLRRGAGRPLLVLHGEAPLDPGAPVVDLLAAHAEVIAPTHPGFGHSARPDDFDTVYDLVHLYLDLLEHLPPGPVTLMGLSFGGWLAAEIAIKSTARVSHLVLANPVGIKVGGREHRDIVDIFAISEDEFLQLAYHDASAGKRDYKSMPEPEVKSASRNREATARYAWSPYMHDPKLRGRLHRIGIPTLLLWGMNDRVLTEAYGRTYCAAIPGARFEPIERAGHFPHVEQPEQFAEKIFAFVGSD